MTWLSCVATQTVPLSLLQPQYTIPGCCLGVQQLHSWRSQRQCLQRQLAGWIARSMYSAHTSVVLARCAMPLHNCAADAHNTAVAHMTAAPTRVAHYWHSAHHRTCHSGPNKFARASCKVRQHLQTHW